MLSINLLQVEQAIEFRGGGSTVELVCKLIWLL